MRYKLLLVVVLLLGAAASTRAAEVADDSDLQVVRQALATPNDASRLAPLSEPAAPPKARATSTEHRVTIRLRDEAGDSASISVTLDLDQEDAGATRWLDAVSGSEVLAIEWGDGAFAVRVD